MKIKKIKERIIDVYPSLYLYAVLICALFCIISYISAFYVQENSSTMHGIIYEVKDSTITVMIGEKNGEPDTIEVEKPFLPFYQKGDTIYYQNKEGRKKVAFEQGAERKYLIATAIFRLLVALSPFLSVVIFLLLISSGKVILELGLLIICLVGIVFLFFNSLRMIRNWDDNCLMCLFWN